MNETTLLIAFIAVTSVAVVLQTAILAGMYVSMRKMMERTESLQQRVNEQVVPLVAKVRSLVDESAPKLQLVVTNLGSLVDESRPKLQQMVSNIAESSSLLRSQAGKIDEAVTEFVDKARGQAGRAEVLASRTMERVDSTAAAVQHSVLTPLRHLSGLAEGVMAGVSQFAGSRKERRRAKSVPSDDMFI